MKNKIFYIYFLKLAFTTKCSIALSARIQTLLQFFGIAIHNPFRDECCCDFACCHPNNDSNCWLHIGRSKLSIIRKVWYEPTAPIGHPGRTFIKKTKWVFNVNEKAKV